MQFHGRRQLLAQHGQTGLDGIRHLYGVGARLLAHCQDQPYDAVDAGARQALLHAVAHLGNVLHVHRRGAVVPQDDLPYVPHLLELTHGPNHVIGAPAFQVPADSGDVLGAQHLDHALQRNAGSGQPVAVDQHLNLAFVSAPDVDGRHAGDLL